MNKIKLGVTGSSGFIGWHLKCYLSQSKEIEMIDCNRDTFNNDEKLETFIENSDVILHLAGMARGDSAEDLKINEKLAKRLTTFIKKSHKKVPIIYANSKKKFEDCPYGQSKLAAEKVFKTFSEEEGIPFCNMIIPNVFGEEALPGYNSVIATFSYKIFNQETPIITEDRKIDYIYTHELCQIIEGAVLDKKYLETAVIGTYIKTSEILELLKKYYEYYKINTIPQFENSFEENLYKTFISYTDIEYLPEVHADERGSLIEIVKAFGKGKTFISTTNPGYNRGGHFHFNKIEKMYLIKGSAEITLKKIFSDKVIIKNINSGDNKIITFPNFYEHSIKNLGNEELIILFWANETDNACSPDTYVMEQKNE